MPTVIYTKTSLSISPSSMFSLQLQGLLGVCVSSACMAVQTKRVKIS